MQQTTRRLRIAQGPVYLNGGINHRMRIQSFKQQHRINRLLHLAHRTDFLEFSSLKAPICIKLLRLCQLSQRVGLQVF